MQPTKKLEPDTAVWRLSADMPIKLDDTNTHANASPAAQLQDQLYKAFKQAEITEKWSYRRTAAFLLLTCGGFWFCVAALVVQLV